MPISGAWPSGRITRLPSMNREQAFEALIAYRDQVTAAEGLPRFAGLRTSALAELRQQLPGVNSILRGLAPDLPLISAQWIGDHVDALAAAQRATRIIVDSEALDAHRQLDGLPVLPLNLLDQVIADAALPLLNAGKFRQAVNDAATTLNKFAQQRLGRQDVYDLKLMNEAFSDEPPAPGKPRLRCPGDHQLVEIRDQQNGARQLAAGAFLAIRNPAHHMTGDWNPVTAFHYLTILSQVAHYFRHWTLEKYIPPPPDLSALASAYQHQTARSVPTPSRPAATPGGTASESRQQAI